MKFFAAAATFTALAASPAAAVVINGGQVSGGNELSVTSQPGSLFVELGLFSTTPIILFLDTQEEDAGGIRFASVVDSFFTVVGNGNPLRSLTLTLSGGATFGSLGSVAPAFSSFSAVATSTSYAITFLPSEGLGVILGDASVFGSPGTDFIIDVSALEQGARFNLAFNATTVPEPSSWALLIGGFGLVGGALRRRRLVAA